MGDPLADNAYGIDVSKWQTTTPSLAGLDFLFARASIGTLQDERYDQHIAKAKAAGLVTGAYHFGDNGSTADDQARVFLAAAGDVDFYVLDHEGNREMSDAQAKRFVALARAARGRCGLYASLSGFPSFGQDYNWIALWASTPPVKTWKFWQFGGSPIDRDVFNGTKADLLAFAGRGDDMAQAPITDENPKIITAGLVDWFDLDNKTIVSPKAAHTRPLAARPSPYGVGTRRAIYATVGTRRTVLVTPLTAIDPPVPVTDCTQAVADGRAAEHELVRTAAIAAAEGL